MNLQHILVFLTAGLLLGLAFKGRGREWATFALSLLAVFWLQPFSPIRHLDFWLACATLGLTLFIWLLTRSRPFTFQRQDWIAAGVLAGGVTLAGLLRYFEPLCCLTASPPPPIQTILLALLAVGLIACASTRWLPSNRLALAGGVGLLLLAFIVLKSEPLSAWLSAALRALNGQRTALAAAADIRWLGFSYLAFRLLHVLRDRQSGKPIDLSLREFVTYVVFFPALTAGPIDRGPRFAQDLRKPFQLTGSALAQAGERLFLGISKKFILADTLALLALNEVNATQVGAPGWTWLLTYAYALRIFFDFSGYTDIAIGIGLLFGIRLPENFAQPYLKPNLTAFWNSWHITLAQWFRAYFFNPFTRTLRSARRPLPLPAMVFLVQISTMLLIGLWHGITWNFLIWGAWHGVGLFIHNRWSEFLKPRLDPARLASWQERLLDGAGLVLTFHYVTLGWLWFALPTPQLSWQVLLRLFGIGA
jgi:D-alanyl-lipoteichoic acid acyltransferase DltB (MBOAT superfamily)